MVETIRNMKLGKRTTECMYHMYRGTIPIFITNEIVKNSEEENMNERRIKKDERDCTKK